LFDGKAELVDACRSRKMQVDEKPLNLLETKVKAAGVLDGMQVRVLMECICGMPGESQGSVTLRGNLGQILAVLHRVWPSLPVERDIECPGRRSYPDPQPPKARSLYPKA
jgi:hypothetical protein